jgi:NADH:ubiquinone oxidoreductase subunit 4 (subunit M)
MTEFNWLVIALFLPLFPFSAIFILAYKKLPGIWLKSLMLLVWPQVGLLIMESGLSLPDWFPLWALLTSFLYALRSLVLRDVELWTSYIAVSCWALVWLVLPSHSLQQLQITVLGLSLPFALMVLLGGELKQRFGAAYCGLHGGIVKILPRLSALFVFGVLAAIATPVFPGFFSMLIFTFEQIAVSPLNALLLIVIWFFWTWSGMRLIQQLVAGEPVQTQYEDVSSGKAMAYGVFLLLLTLLGIRAAGGL